MSELSRTLLVFFTSKRSGPARRMESVLACIARKERDRLNVMRVDVDSQPELAARFDVREIPTLVLVRDKQVVERVDGRVAAPRIEDMLDRNLVVA